ncbi:MAG: type II toxin-antitoxin system RelE/ParE family toxin [Nevskiaceae bacterium]|nr:MAG: type II toxin-antitoxin system RelE/ParE family toxin [Nevskiaceae bacterium]TBR72788.1 MAG: type II toxin-antitoxin system RelE/ParE family toxin [Nevskiaceae bacterium]
MTCRVLFTQAARDDIVRLHRFLAERNVTAADAALVTIAEAWERLRDMPFACRKADADTPFLRELIIPFGHTGYVALFEIDDAETVTVLAVRHQREEDCH